MNFNSISCSALCIVFVSQTAISGEDAVLHLDRGDRVIPVERARKLLLDIPRGTPVSNLISLVGHPDEVRVQPEAFRTEAEWNRWCYGVSESGELPLIGLVLVSSNLTVQSVKLPCDEWNWPTNTAPPTNHAIPQLLIRSVVLTNDAPTRELSYIARVCLTNAGTTPVELKLDERLSWRPLLQCEVYNLKNTLIFARHRYFHPSPLDSERKLKLMPTEQEQKDIAVFARDVHLGIPRPGKYQLRVGLPLSENFVLWSERYDFTIEP